MRRSDFLLKTILCFACRRQQSQGGLKIDELLRKEKGPRRCALERLHMSNIKEDNSELSLKSFAGLHRRFVSFFYSKSAKMDFIFDCFFEEVLETIERSGLKTRQNRQNVIEQLDSIISGCISGESQSSIFYKGCVEQ